MKNGQPQWQVLVVSQLLKDFSSSLVHSTLSLYELMCTRVCVVLAGVGEEGLLQAMVSHII